MTTLPNPPDAAPDPPEVLLEVEAHHVDPWGSAPFRATGGYLSYFESVYRDQWVFWWPNGEPQAVLYGGDVGWEGHRVFDGGFVPQLILNTPETLWVVACWRAAAGDVSPRERKPVAPDADRQGPPPPPVPPLLTHEQQRRELLYFRHAVKQRLAMDTLGLTQGDPLGVTRALPDDLRAILRGAEDKLAATVYAEVIREVGEEQAARERKATQSD